MLWRYLKLPCVHQVPKVPKVRYMYHITVLPGSQDTPAPGLSLKVTSITATRHHHPRTTSKKALTTINAGAHPRLLVRGQVASDKQHKILYMLVSIGWSFDLESRSNQIKSEQPPAAERSCFWKVASSPTTSIQTVRYLAEYM